MRNTLILAALLVVALLSGSAMAGTLDIGNGTVAVTAHSGGGANFLFGAGTVTGVNGGITDALYNAGVTLTSSTGFFITSYSGNTATFSTSGHDGVLTIGNLASLGFSANVELMTITKMSNGDFDIAITLSNVNVTPGTSGYLQTLGLTGDAGTLHLSFGGNGINMNDLFYVGAGCTGAAKNTQFCTAGSRIAGNYTGSLTTTTQAATVPEPASLILLGTGLLTGGGALRRRLFNR